MIENHLREIEFRVIIVIWWWLFFFPQNQVNSKKYFVDSPHLFFLRIHTKVISQLGIRWLVNAYSFSLIQIYLLILLLSCQG